MLLGKRSVSCSSTEAKYKALANVVANVAWIRLILMDLQVFLLLHHFCFVIMFQHLLRVQILFFHTMIKQLETNLHFVREGVHKGDFQAIYFDW